MAWGLLGKTCHRLVSSECVRSVSIYYYAKYIEYSMLLSVLIRLSADHSPNHQFENAACIFRDNQWFRAVAGFICCRALNHIITLRKGFG
ncbi:MAG: hypothetical protein J07HR59_00718 [Halorubrum sp. J07HR59]|nr:MAG: hypothetical protein J07HR59_00718 [Halorubrum sp. J07HR59]